MKQDNNVIEEIKTGDWKYTPHFKDDAQGHIFSKKEGKLICNIIGASSTSQDKLNDYGQLICEAVNNYQSLKSLNEELVKALEDAVNVINTMAHGEAMREGWSINQLQSIADENKDYIRLNAALQKAKQTIL
jgi:hypothetical protein